MPPARELRFSRSDLTHAMIARNTEDPIMPVCTAHAAGGRRPAMSPTGKSNLFLFRPLVGLSPES